MMKLLPLLLLLLCHLPAGAQHDGFASNGSAKIYYRTFGEGPPLLIINGGPGLSSESYADLAQRLAGGGFETILYDQRGTGRSDIGRPDSSNITIALMAEDIECLRKHLDVESWSILGQSFGGMLAAFYAAEHPGQVRSLIFSSSGGLDLSLLQEWRLHPNSQLSRAAQDSLSYWDRKVADGDTSYTVRLGRARILAPAYLQNQVNLPLVIARLAQVDYPVASLVWKDLERIRFDSRRKLSAFLKPVLIIQGKEDIIPRKIALSAQRVFKNAQLVLMDNCGHFGWLDRPDIYLPAVTRFLQER